VAGVGDSVGEAVAGVVCGVFRVLKQLCQN
jgi:hypothetical protein